MPPAPPSPGGAPSVGRGGAVGARGSRCSARAGTGAGWVSMSGEHKRRHTCARAYASVSRRAVQEA
eukprot:scaffold2261_cov405-Prasinococcus_capsulatus_cf.AAC.1